MKRTRVESERWFDVLLETEDAQAAVMTLGAGESTGGPTNAHAVSDQWLYVVSGSGSVVVEGETQAVAEGDLLVVEAGETHEVRASPEESMESLSLYVPPRPEVDADGSDRDD